MLEHIPLNSSISMAGVIFVLVAASISLFVLKKVKPNADFSDPVVRTKSWWWMIGIVFIALLMPLNITIALIAVLSFFALKEFLSVTPTRTTDANLIKSCYAAIPFQFLWVAMEWYGMFIIFIPVYMFLYLPVVNVLSGDSKDCIRSNGIIHWSLMLTVFCLSHLAYLITLEPINLNAGSIGLVLFLLITTQVNDVAQYICGKSFGKTKISPKISPNKTREGFIGGVVVVMVISVCTAPYLTPLNLLESVMAGGIIAISGFVGDLVMSSIKRDLEVKDMGNLIPGHGGILDRMDSLLFTSPLFFHYIYYLYY